MRALASGRRPDLAQLLLAPANALRLTVGLSHLRGAALDGGAAETRDAMLRIGYFGPSTAPHQQDLIQSMFNTAMAPLRQDAPFDFGRSDLLEWLRDMGLAIDNDRNLAHVPPAATLFLHRKIGGMYLMAAKLRARIALRPMVETYCRDTTPPR